MNLFNFFDETSATSTAGGSATTGSRYQEIMIRDAIASGRDYQSSFEPAIDQEERPKYDPYQAVSMWRPEALSVTSKPRKRPLRQVEFNQVSKLRPVRPRYLSRKK